MEGKAQTFWVGTLPHLQTDGAEEGELQKRGDGKARTGKRSVDSGDGVIGDGDSNKG